MERYIDVYMCVLEISLSIEPPEMSFFPKLSHSKRISGVWLPVMGFSFKPSRLVRNRDTLSAPLDVQNRDYPSPRIRPDVHYTRVMNNVWQNNRENYMNEKTSCNFSQYWLLYRSIIRKLSPFPSVTKSKIDDHTFFYLRHRIFLLGSTRSLFFCPEPRFLRPTNFYVFQLFRTRENKDKF